MIFVLTNVYFLFYGNYVSSVDDTDGFAHVENVNHIFVLDFLIFENGRADERDVQNLNDLVDKSPI